MNTGSPTGQPPVIPREVKIVLSVLVISAMVMILNETILSVALPAIMSDFNVGADVAQWLTTGFMLTMAVVIPTTGFLLQRFTTKAIFLTALSLFAVGTLVAAIAPAFSVLLGARVIQAAGTALVLPLLMTVALTVIPPERRGTVMGIIAIVISVAPAIGPTVSGFILNSLSWHWLFWVMLPIALLALIAGGSIIRNIGETRTSPFDVPSVILSAAAFGGLVYGLSSMSSIIEGEGTAAITAIIVGVFALVGFVWRQIGLGKKDRALLDLSPFRIRNFTVSLVVVLLAMGSLLGTIMVLPIYLQTALGVSALVTGLVVMPGGLLQGLAAPLIGRLYDAVGPRPILIPGAILMTATVWWMTTLSTDSPTWIVVAMHICFSIGLALMMTPLMTTALGSVPAHMYSHGSAILNTLQQLAGAAGTAAMIAALSIGTGLASEAGRTTAEATATGTRSAFILAGVIAIFALIGSFFVTRVQEPVEQQVPATADEADEGAPRAV
ncbi:MDR family MFS transporter [Corynebacterium halotolerans]|uniref:Lincomycin-resistance protein n=1 Tax=Corynebacterium halotolerans YIM 70093 = DSM 44683 TaxID=1121362 RepID=M1NVB3_9CORY|nr:MDR family MFS transporter [Corynebacterium halotolerans]AGF73427.1 lincomycin-resistance protein [Corynebacterium halotolerans YIM 70093 = DSM 44683]